MWPPDRRADTQVGPYVEIQRLFTLNYRRIFDSGLLGKEKLYE